MGMNRFLYLIVPKSAIKEHPKNERKKKKGKKANKSKERKKVAIQRTCVNVNWKSCLLHDYA